MISWALLTVLQWAVLRFVQRSQHLKERKRFNEEQPCHSYPMENYCCLRRPRTLRERLGFCSPLWPSCWGAVRGSTEWGIKPLQFANLCLIMLLCASGLLVGAMLNLSLLSAHQVVLFRSQKPVHTFLLLIRALQSRSLKPFRTGVLCNASGLSVYTCGLVQ